jgi:hypothetical protein
MHNIKLRGRAMTTKLLAETPKFDFQIQIPMILRVSVRT